MRVLALYGKGGSGKSTVASNLAALFARDGHRVLLFGCDPKSDSCYALVEGEVETVMDQWLQRGEAELSLDHCLMRGRHGVDCIEVGGPIAGTGCGGRGITKAFELVGDPEALRRRYDVILFDVLGDVVCGGFSAPMRAGYAEEVYIVTSGEFRSLYAANNIARAVKLYARSGVRMGGFIANLRGMPNEQDRVLRLARLIQTRVAHAIPKDPAIVDAELARVPVVDSAPDSPAGRAFRELFADLAATSASEGTVPHPLTRAEFDAEFLARREE